MPRPHPPSKTDLLRAADELFRVESAALGAAKAAEEKATAALEHFQTTNPVFKRLDVAAARARAKRYAIEHAERDGRRAVVDRLRHMILTDGATPAVVREVKRARARFVGAAKKRTP